jgi:hypothetical protein
MGWEAEFYPVLCGKTQRAPRGNGIIRLLSKLDEPLPNLREGEAHPHFPNKSDPPGFFGFVDHSTVG